MENRRLDQYDNVKFLCILLVVIGHFIESYTETSEFYRSLFLAIYSFHMPMFFFISGLFKRPSAKGDPFPLGKVLYYLILGYLLKAFTYVLQLIGTGKGSFNFFGGEEIPWFLFVLAAYTVLGFFTRWIPSWLVIALSVLAGALSGYVDRIGDTLWLSRICVFMPFYVAGYYLTPERLREFTRHWYVKLISLLGSLVFFAVCFADVDCVYGLRRLFTGKNPFSVVLIDGCNVLHRLLCMAISACICIALLSLMTERNLGIITRFGRNTLAVFFWHTLIRNALRYSGVFKLITQAAQPVWEILIILMAMAITFILSIDIFMVPFNALKKIGKWRIG